MEPELPTSARRAGSIEWLWAAAALVGAILIALVTRTLGPLAVSDDDFARVVIAQRFALEPRWDPSGTSWLPVPFYWDGIFTALFGQALEAARLAALVRAGLGTLLLFAAGRLLGLSGRIAALAALIPLLLPTTRIFAIATVPEYLTACLATFAGVALLRPFSPEELRLRSLGLFCLLLATLSRYETWPFACAIAIMLGSTRQRRDVASGALCLLGPALWLLHGSFTHGSSWFFIDRVRSYKLALGGDTRTHFETIFSYLSALWTHEPLLVGLALFALLSRGRAIRRRALSLLTPPLGQLAFLSLADLTASAPTHHAERAIMVFWTTLPIVTTWLLDRPFSTAGAAWFTRAAAALALGLNLLIPRPPSGYVHRGDEELVGRRLNELQGAPERTLIASLDFSYLATMAAAGHPDRFIAITTGDPRDSSREPILSRIRKELASSEANWIVMPLCLDLDGLGPTGPKFVTRFESKDYRILERSTEEPTPAE